VTTAPPPLRRRYRHRSPLAFPLITLALVAVSGCGAGAESSGSTGSTGSSVPTGGSAATPTAASTPASLSPTASLSPATARPSSPSAAAPRSAPTRPIASAPTAPASNTCAARRKSVFVRVASAEVAANDRVRIHGRLQGLVCGGADDSHFEDSAATVVFTLVPSARVLVLPTGPAGPQQRSIRPAALPSYVAAERSSDIFAVTGSAGAVTALVEQYQP
jgi:hypothetical protein